MDDRGNSTLEFVFKDQGVQRLDKFLVECLPELSRSRIQSLIKDGCVLIDGAAPRKAGQMLEGQAAIQVRLPPPAPSDLIPEAIPLDIIFENDDLMVVNKPAGMVVHPAAGHLGGTLVHAALAHAPEMEGIGGEQRPGVVHRLDKNTSGLILLAKNDRAHRWLQDQFRLRKVEKVYLALVDGHPPTPNGRIEAPIGRDHKVRKKMAVVALEKGRAAVSEYLTLESFRGAHAARSPPDHRAHAPDPPAPGLSRLSGGRGYGVWQAQFIDTPGASFPARRPPERALAQGKTACTFEAPLPPELAQTFGATASGATA